MTYEYACTACGHAWEAEQSISAAPLSECPHCHQASAKRQISGGAGFILKGGGWYADLYSSAGSAKAAPESSSSSTDSPKTETKTTTSTETSSAPAAPAAPAKTSTGAASS
jgi:putative FmdB family regulatory protein